MLPEMIKELQISIKTNGVFQCGLGDVTFVGSTFSKEEYTKWSNRFLNYPHNFIPDAVYSRLKVMDTASELPISVWEKVGNAEPERRYAYLGHGGLYESPANNSPIIYIKNDGKIRRLDHLGSHTHLDRWIKFFTELRNLVQSPGTAPVPKDFPVFMASLAFIDSSYWDYPLNNLDYCMNVLREVTETDTPIPVIVGELHRLSDLSSKYDSYYWDDLYLQDGTVVLK